MMAGWLFSEGITQNAKANAAVHCQEQGGVNTPAHGMHLSRHISVNGGHPWCMCMAS